MLYRIHDGTAMKGERNSANLVFSNGCRNPKYNVLAPANPWRDGVNSLINNFDFRVFMFQDMEPEDNVMITAKVTACVEAVDCTPVNNKIINPT